MAKLGLSGWKGLGTHIGLVMAPGQGSPASGPLMISGSLDPGKVPGFSGNTTSLKPSWGTLEGGEERRGEIFPDVSVVCPKKKGQVLSSSE